MKEVTLLFDGGCSPNPGRGYGSYQVTDEYGKKHIFRVRFGSKETNNTAEFKALIAGVEAIAEQITDEGHFLSDYHLHVVGDSLMILNMSFGVWRGKVPHLFPLRDEARRLLGRFISKSYAWQPRERTVAVLGH